MADGRVSERVRVIERLRHAGARPLQPWRVSGNGAGTITLPFRWRRSNQPVRFRHTLRLDDDLRGRDLLLRLDVAEGLLFVDGEPYHGLDRQHHDVVLPATRTRAARLELAIEASRAAPFGGAWFRDARIGPYHEPGERLLHAVTALERLWEELRPGRDRSLVAKVLEDVDVVLRSATRGGSPAAVLARAAERLEAFVRQRSRHPAGPGVVHVVGHSHIDVVWLWTLAETRRKCARTFATTLRLMERYPAFRFAQSQAQLYAYVKEQYPGIEAQLRARIREGRWEVIGSAWVEPDCNIPSGESLVRQIVHGRRYFEREFEVACDVLWLPDTFGYAWSLPQILRQSGIRSFFTTKLRWNDTTRFPHASFWWQGLDGSRVLAHIPPIGLEGLATPKHLSQSWREYAERRRTPHVLQTYGYGDGGGGVTAEQVHALQVLAHAPGLPASRPSTVAAFFGALRRDGARLPVWRDELYLELHRGTYTTHAWLKRANRKAEASLYTTELLCALASACDHRTPWTDPSPSLDALWKRLLLNQFHDIVPGTAVEEAYEDTRRDFAEVAHGCATLQQAAIERLLPVAPASSRRVLEASRAPAGSAGSRAGDATRVFTIFNPLPWERVEHLQLAATGPVEVTDANGQALASQAVRDGGEARVVCATRVPALGCVRLTVTPAGQPLRRRPARTSDARTLDTPLVRVMFDEHGAVMSLVDKAHDRDIVVPGHRLNVFQAFRDEPVHWEAWDIDPDFERKPVDLFSDAKVRILERGPVRWRARVILSGASRTRLEQDVLLHRDSPRVDFVTRVRWHERRTLLKVAFPLAVDTREATYEIPFGAIGRDTRGLTPRDRARWEVAGQQWADLSGRGYGVSLLNDCKYGYDCRGTTLRLTLIRSPRYPHHAEPKTKTSRRVTDQGEHRFAYALLPHAGSWRGAETVRRAREFNVPVLVLDGPRSMRLPPLLHVEAANVQVSAVKLADEPTAARSSRDLVVRLYEAHGTGGPADVHIGVPCDQVHEADLLERPRRSVRMRDGRLRLHFRPFEIKTLRLTPRGSDGRQGDRDDVG